MLFAERNRSIWRCDFCRSFALAIIGSHTYTRRFALLWIFFFFIQTSLAFEFYDNWRERGGDIYNEQLSLLLPHRFVYNGKKKLYCRANAYIFAWDCLEKSREICLKLSVIIIVAFYRETNVYIYIFNAKLFTKDTTCASAEIKRHEN